MFTNKRWSLLIVAVMLGIVVLAACQPEVQVQEREVTRVVTETIEVEGGVVEVTRVVTEVVQITPTAAPVRTEPKDLVVCMAQEPDTLYPNGGSMLAARAVQHAIFDSPLTNLSFGYQADSLVKVPSLADGDAVLNQVNVGPGDIVLSASHGVVTLGADGAATANDGTAIEGGVMLQNADGDEVEYDGSPVSMDQLVVDFEWHPLVWSDGIPVTADDSVYSFELSADPDTPVSKFLTDRTASYEATGDLTNRWTGIPGFRSSTYFANAWTPYPRHVWGEFTAAELLEAPESARMPVGHGAFVVTEWVAGDRIELVRNEYYWRPGLPNLDSLTYKFIPNTNQLIAQLLAGQCDIGTQDGMAVDQSPFLIEAENNGLLVPYFQTGTVYEHIDFNIDPVDDRIRWFEDVRVRQAMTMCTNRQGMVDNIFFGRSEVIHTYVPSVHPLYPEDGLTEWPYDPAAANALLDEVYPTKGDDGWRRNENGDVFRVTLGTTAGNQMRTQLTQIFKENMIQCGIDIVLEYIPAGQWFADGPDGPLFGRRYDLGEFAWLTGVEPACGLYKGDEIPGPDNAWAGQNQTGWVHDEYTSICNVALGNLPGTAEYEESHKEAQRIFSQEVPVIPLFLRLKVAAARPEVLNFSVDPTQNSELYNIYEIDLAR
jgi:peptide/nickel transport system substrate-binding protein